MSMLLAIIAFTMAFGALWFTSEIARRADARGKLLVKPHLTHMTAALSRAENQIRDLTRALESAEKEIKTLKQLRLADLEVDMAAPPTLQKRGVGREPDVGRAIPLEETPSFRPTGTGD